MSKKKRVSLTTGQKREICETKERNPNLSHIELGGQYGIGKSTVSEILKEKE
ncbi:12822_t:CDS:1, partial [Ambispora gerdemannii]